MSDLRAPLSNKEQLPELLETLISFAHSTGSARDAELFGQAGRHEVLRAEAGEDAARAAVISFVAALESENERLKETALTVLRDAELLVELVDIGPRERSENLVEDAVESYRAAIRELLLPVATRLLTSARRISGDSQ